MIAAAVWRIWKSSTMRECCDHWVFPTSTWMIWCSAEVEGVERLECHDTDMTRRSVWILWCSYSKVVLWNLLLENLSYHSRAYHIASYQMVYCNDFISCILTIPLHYFDLTFWWLTACRGWHHPGTAQDSLQRQSACEATRGAEQVPWCRKKLMSLGADKGNILGNLTYDCTILIHVICRCRCLMICLDSHFIHVVRRHWFDFCLLNNGNLRFSIYHRGWAPVEKVVLGWQVLACFSGEVTVRSGIRLDGILWVCLRLPQLSQVKCKRMGLWMFSLRSDTNGGFCTVCVRVTYVLPACWSPEYDMCDEEKSDCEGLDSKLIS